MWVEKKLNLGTSNSATLQNWFVYLEAVVACLSFLAALILLIVLYKSTKHELNDLNYGNMSIPFSPHPFYPSSKKSSDGLMPAALGGELNPTKTMTKLRAQMMAFEDE